MASIEENVIRLRGMKRGNQFTPYIDYIVFPRYRRIATGQRIDFTFPLTVLVGRNGTGKSSVLHALYGAPHGRSVSSYWFGTAVDPVEKGDEVEVEVEEEGAGGKKRKLREEQKAAFWYSYRDNGVERQALKQRVRREVTQGFEDHENWEPARPNESYGMTPIPRTEEGRGRHPQIEMQVSYLNLRYELSAYDRCFNFWSESSQTKFKNSKRWQATGGKRKPKEQDYIRARAVRLNKALSMTKPYKVGPTVFSKKPVQLTANELALVSRIVGKKYLSGTLLNHRLYDNAWANSVRFKSEGGEYTEANAGSGETSVVQIVRLFEEAKENSLLLLDEPETSLHPGAQRELLAYVLEQIVKKRLQVVLSTHAPSLVTGLPKESIKVMRRPPGGLVVIDQGLSVEEAFYEIGQAFEATCNVIVEDRLAKEILEEVAKTKGAGFAAKLRVEYRPGGDGEMKKDITAFMHGRHQPVFVFDGDKKPPAGHTDPGTIAVNQQTAEHLDTVIKTQTGQDIKFQQNSKMTVQGKAELRSKYLTYYPKRVFYLPFPSAEAAVWDDEVCKSLLTVLLVDPTRIGAETAAIAAEPDYKKKFDLLAKAMGHGDLHPTPVHSMFVTRFLATKSDKFEEVSMLLDQVVQASEA